MTLNERQFEFMKALESLLLWLHAKGYGIAGGELYRTPEQAELNAQKGIGIKNSVHTLSLAIDLRLFMRIGESWVYLTETHQYKEAGEYWESLGGSWGGRFSRADGNHFSFEWKGVK